MAFRGEIKDDRTGHRRRRDPSVKLIRFLCYTGTLLTVDQATSRRLISLDLTEEPKVILQLPSRCRCSADLALWTRFALQYPVKVHDLDRHRPVTVLLIEEDRETVVRGLPHRLLHVLESYGEVAAFAVVHS